LKDSEFKRLVVLEARGANAKTAGALIDLDIMVIELGDLRMGVILDRLRAVNVGREAADGRTPEEEAALRDQIASWFDDLELLWKQAQRGRKSLAERIDQATPGVLSSPYSRALAGPFRLELIAGAAAQEYRTFPADGVPDGTSRPSGATATARDWLGEPRARFTEAARALDAAVAAAAPKGEATMKPEQRVEALLMRAELLMCTGWERLAAGDSKGGRESFAKVVDLVDQIGALRKLADPEKHPDQFMPLIGLATAMLDEARLRFDEGNPAEALETIREAGKALARADGLPLSKDNPLRLRLPPLQSRIEVALARVATKALGTDAADAAARRVRRAIDGTAVSDASSRP
jgi:hypothetical protein